MKNTFKPGQTIKKSGQYEKIGPRGGKTTNPAKTTEKVVFDYLLGRRWVFGENCDIKRGVLIVMRIKNEKDYFCYSQSG